MFEAMLESWRRQRVGSLHLNARSTEASLRVVRRFRTSSGKWPWEWRHSTFDDWMADLVSIHKLKGSTLRRYQHAIRAFCDFVTSPRYEWIEACEQKFRMRPVQVVDEENSLRHLQDYEGGTGRLVLTSDEIEGLFAYADSQVSARVKSGTKGAVTAFRTAAVFKVTYAWGLRAREVANLDLNDFYPNPRAPEHGKYGFLAVRFGKAERGGPPKRRAVPSLHDWSPPVISDYVKDFWPLIRIPNSGALWVTERGGVPSPARHSELFSAYRDALGLPTSLTLHSLRRSYATHLLEAGTDIAFISRLLGHKHISTTMNYIHINEASANRMLDEAIRQIRQLDIKEGAV